MSGAITYGAGVNIGPGAGRLRLAAKITQFYDGINQVQRMVMAWQLVLARAPG